MEGLELVIDRSHVFPLGDKKSVFEPQARCPRATARLATSGATDDR